MSFVWKVMAGLFLSLPTAAFFAGWMVGPSDTPASPGPTIPATSGAPAPSHGSPTALRPGELDVGTSGPGYLNGDGDQDERDAEQMKPRETGLPEQSPDAEPNQRQPQEQTDSPDAEATPTPEEGGTTTPTPSPTDSSTPEPSEDPGSTGTPEATQGPGDTQSGSGDGNGTEPSAG